MNFHGGDIYRLNRDIIDFSSNINPLGVPDSFRRMLFERILDFTRYPDIDYVEVRKSIADYLDIKDIESIIPGNGAVDLIYKLVTLKGAKRVVGLCPTFSEYERAARVNGTEYIGIPAFNADFSAVDMEMLRASVKPNSAVIICNPNNPTGTMIEKHELIKLAGTLAKMEGCLIIDEAFIEFTDGYPEDSMLDVLWDFKNITLVRAATKFFGMPGIRLGYAVTADEATARSLREIMEPWSINTAAVIAASSIFQDVNYIDNTRILMKKEREFLYEELSGFKELKIYPSKCNYHLLKISKEKMTSAELKDAMLREGVLIRTAEGFEGLSAYHFRLAVKDRSSNEILLKTLDKVLE